MYASLIILLGKSSPVEAGLPVGITHREHLTFAKKNSVNWPSLCVAQTSREAGNSEGALRSHYTANLPLGDAPHPYSGYVLKILVKGSLPDDNGKNPSAQPLPIFHYLLWKLNHTRKNFQTGAISPLSFCVIESIIRPTN